MIPLRDAYPPVGKKVRLYRDGRDVGGLWELCTWGTTTRAYQWGQRDERGWFEPLGLVPDETRDAWEAV